jgi:hypothetical protein
MISSQVQFDELDFPYQKQFVIDQYKADSRTNILSRIPSGVTWVQYDKTQPSKKCQTPHYDPERDTFILRLVDETDTFTKTTQHQYCNDVISVQRAFVASLRVVQGLPDTIDPGKPPRNYKDAMNSPDNQEWAEAYQKEFQGLKGRGTFATAKTPKGAKIPGTTTRLDYKIDSGSLDKRKVIICILGNHQLGDIFKASDFNSPVLKAP